MEIAALVISIVSLICSIIIAIVGWIKNKELKAIEINSKFCSRIYDEYIINIVPNARKKIKYINNGKLTGYIELCEILNNMVKDSIFYKYQDINFYKNVTNELQDLCDIIVNFSSIIVTNKTKQRENLFKIDEHISLIYGIINKKRITK